MTEYFHLEAARLKNSKFIAIFIRIFVICFPIMCYMYDADLFAGDLANPRIIGRRVVYLGVTAISIILVLISLFADITNKSKIALNCAALSLIIFCIILLYYVSGALLTVGYIGMFLISMTYYRSFIVTYGVVWILCLIPSFQHTLIAPTKLNIVEVILQVVSVAIFSVLTYISSSVSEGAMIESSIQVSKVEAQNAERDEIMKNIQKATIELDGISSSISNAMTSTASGINEIANSSQSMVTSSDVSRQSIEDIDSKVKDINENISNVYVSAKASSTLAENMHNISLSNKDHVNDMSTIIEEIKSSISITNSYMTQIALSSKNISSMSEQINSISEQTNLLSLNANIEAARAGEHGKGFAIVADEIGKLADMSKNLSNSIIKITNENKDIVDKTSVAVVDTISKIDKGNEFLQDIMKSSDAVCNKSLQNMDELTELSSYLEEQVSILEGIRENTKSSVSIIVNQSELLEGTTAFTEEINASSEEVSLSINTLRDSILLLKSLMIEE